uniref:RRM domain-containing protein n=1 Tax=Oncorhynchus tshawytscha TaxID=74940 RepID=A0A8C8DEP9_ONCTS
MPRCIGCLSHEHVSQRFFSGYGKLLEVDLKDGYDFNSYVQFDPIDTVYSIGKDGYSSRSRTGLDKYGPPARTEYRLIVKNLSSRCSWQDIKDFMRQAGEGTYADAHKQWTNEGVIEFQSRLDMTRALDKLYSTYINGRKICLVEDKPRRRRSSPGSCSKSGLTSPQKCRPSLNSCVFVLHRSLSCCDSCTRSDHKSCSRSVKKSHSKSQTRSNSRSSTRKSRSKSRSRSGTQVSQLLGEPQISLSHKQRLFQGCLSVRIPRVVLHQPTENGDGERSKSPFPQEDLHQSKSPAKHPASGSTSRSKSWSRSASRD